MKKLIILILLCSNQVFSQTGNTCSIYGDTKGNTVAANHHKFVDSCKNRSSTISNYRYTEIKFDDMASLTVTNNMTWDTSVYLDGYILEIQDGGLESCNCHSSIYKDTHIYIVKDSNETNKANAIIVEATPRFKSILGTTNDLKKLVGKHVRVCGYLFRDDEHKANSTIDNGKGNLWRHTVWEIHPITKIIQL